MIFLCYAATNVKGVEFAAYQLKDVDYQWYEEWEQTKGDNAESALWEDFSSSFLDLFFIRSWGRQL